MNLAELQFQQLERLQQDRRDLEADARRLRALPVNEQQDLAGIVQRITDLSAEIARGQAIFASLLAAAPPVSQHRTLSFAPLDPQMRLPSNSTSPMLLAPIPHYFRNQTPFNSVFLSLLSRRPPL